MNDEELIEQVAAGSAQAFQELYSRYHKRIFTLCFHYLQQKEDAEEALQDVFLVVHRSAHKFQNRSACSTWLYRIAVNKCLDKIRYRDAKRHFILFTHLFEDRAASSDTARYSEEQTTALYKAINALPPNQRSAIILTQIQELAVKEAAAIMDSTPKAVESLLQRAKANLKKNLKKNG